jgi:hypothetical protein
MPHDQAAIAVDAQIHRVQKVTSRVNEGVTQPSRQHQGKHGYPQDKDTHAGQRPTGGGRSKSAENHVHVGNITGS